MSWVNIIIIIFMFLFIGYIANLGKNKYIFLNAALLSLILLVSSFVALVIGCIIVIFLDFIIKLNNGLFTFGLIIILVSGSIEYILINFLIKKYFNSDLILIVVEYFIQWTLIYLTLYQFITQTLNKKTFDINLKNIVHILDIATLNLTILPVLLISWISITMTKIHQK